MGQNKLLTIREVSEELGITEQQVIDLAETGKIPAYKLGGLYLRFRSEHIQELKRKLSKTLKGVNKISPLEQLRDFFYFNDFYILTALIIIVMLTIIFKT